MWLWKRESVEKCVYGEAHLWGSASVTKRVCGEVRLWKRMSVPRCICWEACLPRSDPSGGSQNNEFYE